jgi:hypothetical protein
LLGRVTIKVVAINGIKTSAEVFVGVKIAETYVLIFTTKIKEMNSIFVFVFIVYI